MSCSYSCLMALGQVAKKSISCTQGLHVELRTVNGVVYLTNDSSCGESEHRSTGHNGWGSPVLQATKDDNC